LIGKSFSGMFAGMKMIKYGILTVILAFLFVIEGREFLVVDEKPKKLTSTYTNAVYRCKSSGCNPGSGYLPIIICRDWG
jgi:hypothetical protein